MSRKPKNRIACIRSFQNGKVIYACFLTPEQTKKFIIVDYLTKPEGGSIADKGVGYNRGGREKDAKAFSDSLVRAGSVCTNAISLNDPNNGFEFIPAYNRFPDQGHLVPRGKNSILYCTDGGCRKLGLEDAFDHHGLSDFSIPAVITQLPKSQERRGFIDINTNARRMNNLQTASVQYQMAKIDGISNLDDDEILKAMAYGVTETLDMMSEEEGILSDMFLMAGEKKYGIKMLRANPSKIGKRTVKGSSFVDVLYATGLIKTMSTYIYGSKAFSLKISLIADELNMFWGALKPLTVQMWGINNGNYAFMRGIGLRAMCHLFRFIRTNMELEKEEVSKGNFAIYLESSIMLKDHNKWLTSSGINALNITDQRIVDSSMQDKRGTSYGTIVFNIIIDEICKSHNINKDRVLRAFHGRRFFSNDKNKKSQAKKAAK